jgi:putative component of toxin-antitoxin plasmid stabilization module
MVGWIGIEAHRLMEGVHEVRTEMGSGSMIYVPSFIKIGSDIQKLTEGIRRKDANHVSII